MNLRRDSRARVQRRRRRIHGNPEPRPGCPYTIFTRFESCLPPVLVSLCRVVQEDRSFPELLRGEIRRSSLSAAQTVSPCGEEELSLFVHRLTYGPSKLENETAWTSRSGRGNPWKGKGQRHPLPRPCNRRDARRRCNVVASQPSHRPCRFSRKADVFLYKPVNKRPQSVRRRGEDVSPVRAVQQAFPRVPAGNTGRYTR
ncbi:uncharacterized protein LOC117152412 isoform X2 [Bombus impatiens]|uniref:Uncharacterized protein LOC117152412 isoform X2 n=1 Tax=Bombus impatiens TaxID=132113 RepID=A0A6P8LZY8_BOMIM|nr:uncharacterized protein LOC117152412 isoform X2 [Bombus impatiens]